MLVWSAVSRLLTAAEGLLSYLEAQTIGVAGYVRWVPGGRYLYAGAGRLPTAKELHEEQRRMALSAPEWA